jgi:hypothetical protein
MLENYLSWGGFLYHERINISTNTNIKINININNDTSIDISISININTKINIHITTNTKKLDTPLVCCDLRPHFWEIRSHHTMQTPNYQMSLF